MLIVQLCVLFLLITATALILGLTPERISMDILSLLYKEDSLRRKVAIAQGSAKKSKLQSALLDTYNALKATGSENNFAVLCTVALLGFVAGCILTALIGNIIFFPSFTLVSFLIPYSYARGLVYTYNKQIADELETALSIITTSYISNGDIIYAIESSTPYIHPPVQNIFKEFLGGTKLISSNIKLAIAKMKDKINNEVFHEWCNSLIECQDNASLKSVLQPIVSKLSDLRIINAELQTELNGARNQYLIMVFLTVGNIPMLYFLNREWCYSLFATFPGQIILGLTAMSCAITGLLAYRFTRPIEYRR
jgi:Flp pilus assembly protein TadB